jgi:hypothetical protein
MLPTVITRDPDFLQKDRPADAKELVRRALREIELLGFVPVTLRTSNVGSYGAHYHRVDEVLFMIDGTLSFWDVETGGRFDVTPGDRLQIRAERVHCVKWKRPAEYVMGLSKAVDIDDFMVAAEDPALNQKANELLESAG